MASLFEDTTFEDFVELITALSDCDGHKERSAMISRFIRDGPGGSLHHETALILKLLLPKTSQRKFNLQDKQLVKYFSEIFNEDKDDMMKDLEKGDVAMTLQKFFLMSSDLKPQKISKVSLKQVDKWLDELSLASGDDGRMAVLTKCTKHFTVDDFLVFIRLIKKDLRINAGSKQVLDALNSQAYAAFQASHDIDAVVEKSKKSDAGKLKLVRKNLSVSIKLMTPVKPMLAEPGRSADAVIAKAATSGGVLVEIKYDGERVQIHKHGDKFVYYSRSLKPVQPHKVEHLKEFIPKAFPGANDLILDSEVLMFDTKTQKPLPFGTLGVHKRNAFKDAVVCIFVFDCLYINGKSLLLEPIKKRREILEQNMTIVPNRVFLSEKHEVNTKKDLNELMARVFSEGLEGLVIKPNDGIYEPGKRHWIKIKKDYLGQGSMADSADLIVLGAYFGTGKKGGLASVFLMGAFDPQTKQFCTVTKVGNGLDDKTLLKLQKQIKMIKISKDYSKVPRWLNVARSMVPDFVVADPKKSLIWEITGAEFSRAGAHTAGAGGGQEGISIRFPRVTRQLSDRTWREATDVPRLESLFAASQDQSDWSRRLEAISLPSNQLASRDALKRSFKEVEDKHTDDDDAINDDVKITKKPRLVRVRDSMGFRYLRELFDGFVIDVPKALVDDPSFDMLHRRLVACGATVIGVDLLNSNRSATHIVDWPVPSNATVVSDDPVHITVEWLEQSIKENKMQPLPTKRS
nr:DNA ligase 3 [Hymenolepis microstoma]